MAEDYSWVRGFNYQPGYAFNTYEAWRFFDADAIRSELTNGKKLFPGFNTVRFWLSYEAFRYEEDRQVNNFETFLQIADSLGLVTIPCLLNRWHDRAMDNGGVYLDHIIPESNWCSQGESIWQGYIDKIVAPHKEDPRILLWDMCNEPFSYGACDPEFKQFMFKAEKAWLRDLYKRCKATGCTQPVTFSPIYLPPPCCDDFNDFMDVFLYHTYTPLTPEDDLKTKQEELAQQVGETVEKARSLGKPLLVTECCWGSLSDEMRVTQSRLSLDVLSKQYNLGFVAYALAYSHFADLHDPEDGIVSAPGNLCFIRKDGSLRPGHEFFNEY